MKMCLKSTHLVLNVPRNHEPVATHTIFSDTLEVNIDVQQTQVLMGRDSLVTYVYQMISGKPFINTLENN